jgi:hypothetical protein
MKPSGIEPAASRLVAQCLNQLRPKQRAPEHNLIFCNYIATGYGLDGPGIESRWEARFSAPAQTGPRAQPASCTMGTGSFSGVESDRGVTLTPHPLIVPRSKNRVEIYPYSPSGPSWPVKRVKPTYLVSFPL